MEAPLGTAPLAKLPSLRPTSTCAQSRFQHEKTFSIHRNTATQIVSNFNPFVLKSAHLDGGVAAAIEDLPRLHGLDRHRHPPSGLRAISLSQSLACVRAPRALSCSCSGLCCHSSRGGWLAICRGAEAEGCGGATWRAEIFLTSPRRSMWVRLSVSVIRLRNFAFAWRRGKPARGL